MKKRAVALSLLLTGSLLLSACHKEKELNDGPENTAGTRVQGNTTIMPENVIQMGDVFEYYPAKATGHFLCTVTGARIVTEESELPLSDKIYNDWLFHYIDGEEIEYNYPEWFTEGGAIDQGCRILMIDLTVTNVDAEAVVDKGGSSADRGWFYDPYAFYAPHFGSPVDLTNLTISNISDEEVNHFYSGLECLYFSRRGEFSETDIRDSLGIDDRAIKVSPGQTVSFTLGFAVNTNFDGSPKDVSMLMFCINSDRSAERGTFVDLKLGGETPEQE